MAPAIDTLAYATKLREAGFSEEQAAGQARALAAAMTDSLTTKQDLRESELRVEARFEAIDARFAKVDARFEALETQLEVRFKAIDSRFADMEARFEARFDAMNSRFSEMDARVDARLSDLERRITVRLGSMIVAGVGVLSVLETML